MAEEALGRLVEAVRKYYADNKGSPLLLSSFGKNNPDLNASLKQQFGSLKAAVRAVGDDHLRIVDNSVGREAVAPANIAAEIEHKIHEQSASRREDSTKFDSLPTSVRVAFCVRTEAGEHVAIEIVPPFRYGKISSPALIRPTQRILPDSFRKPGLTLATASLGDRESLWRSFLAWTDEVKLDPATFRRSTNTNALSRLLAAQPQDIIARIVLPADIAALLLKQP